MLIVIQPHKQTPPIHKKALYTHQPTLTSGLHYRIGFATKKLGQEKNVKQILIKAVLEIEASPIYHINILEITLEKDCIHITVESMPDHSPEYSVEALKRKTQHELRKSLPELLQKGSFLGAGYFIETIAGSYTFSIMINSRRYPYAN